MNNTDYITHLNSVKKYFTQYSILIISAIGVPGNLISLIIFVRLIGKKTNMGFLYSCQCGIDLVSILINLFFILGSGILFNISASTLNDSSCKAYMFFRRYGLHVSAWMAVITSLDRYLFVLYEHRFTFMRKKLVLLAVILITFSLLVLINTPNLLYYLTPGRVCTATFDNVISLDIISILMRTYIPFILMGYFNYRIIRTFINKKRTMRNVSWSNIQNQKRKENEFTRAVLSFDAIYFITHFPLSVYFILYAIKLYSNVLQNDAYQSAVYSLVQAVMIYFSLLDQTFSILTYMTFNKLFRKELVRVLTMYLPFIPSSIRNLTKTDGSIERSLNTQNNSVKKHALNI